MPKKKIGLIVAPPGVFIDMHEKRTADFLATTLGYDITFLVPSRHQGTKTPDIEMISLHWEIKCPKGKSSRTIENNLRLALLQSPNIVLDLRRMDGRIPTNRQLVEIQRQFELAKSIRRIIVITRQHTHIEFKR